MKVKLVRIGVHLTRCASCTTYTFPALDLSNVDALIQSSHTSGTKVVITVATGNPGGQADEFWSKPTLRASIVDLWKGLAQKYRDEPGVAAYDLINEPYPSGKADDPTPWLAFATELITAIRSVDPNHTIVVEGSPNASPYWFANMKPLPFANLVYSVHFYEPMQFTHQGVLDQYPMGVRYPDDTNTAAGLPLTRSQLSNLLQPVRDFSRRNNVPIYVGEFGCVRWAPDGSHERYLRDLVDLFEAEGWAWTYHSYREWTGWDPEIASSDPAVQTRTPSAPVITMLKSYFSR